MDFFSPAQIVGYLAFVLGIAGFLQKSDRRLKLLVGNECLAYTLHFILLGNPAAAGTAATNAVRLFTSAKWMSAHLAVLFIAINLGVGCFTATTAMGWLLILFNGISTYAAFCQKGVPMRLCFLASSTAWLVNNILSGSIGGTALEACIIVANAATVVRLLRAPSTRPC